MMAVFGGVETANRGSWRLYDWKVPFRHRWLISPQCIIAVLSLPLCLKDQVSGEEVNPP